MSIFVQNDTHVLIVKFNSARGKHFIHPSLWKLSRERFENYIELFESIFIAK